VLGAGAVLDQVLELADALIDGVTAAIELGQLGLAERLLNPGDPGQAPARCGVVSNRSLEPFGICNI